MRSIFVPWLITNLFLFSLLLTAACEKNMDNNILGSNYPSDTDSTDENSDTNHNPNDSDNSDDDTSDGNDCEEGDDCVDGCEGVDFLFIIDDSGSMEDEQTQLIEAFPDFIDSITETLELDSFHIMVTRTAPFDERFGPQRNEKDDCKAYCEAHSGSPIANKTSWCREPDDIYIPCRTWIDPSLEWWNNCDVVFGAGIRGYSAYREGDSIYDLYPDYPACDLSENKAYIDADQSNIVDTFNCIASIGTLGGGHEKPMESMMRSIGQELAPGGCNEGFIREKSVLAVVFITDENEILDPKEIEVLNGGSSYEFCSPGTPQYWKEQLLKAKDGKEEAIVVLGIFGDNDLSDGICQKFDPVNGNGALGAPKLREFVDLFGKNGTFCSVCSQDYGQCFEDHVKIIDTSCDSIIIE